MSLSVTTPFTQRIPVRFHHTDPAGYVFFPRYFEMLQAAVEDWFNEGLGLNYYDLVNNERLGLPTAHTECTFTKPCRLGDFLDLTLFLERIGNSSIRVRFVGMVDGEMRLEARSVLVIISLNDGAPRRISEDLRMRLEAYMAGQGAQPDAPPARTR